MQQGQTGNKYQVQQPPKCKPRFKGIENFLKRIAFNLGNTPSQTEVKIISCIPIDVTDLQHKIINLERELEDCARRGGDAVVNMALGTTTFHPTSPCNSQANTMLTNTARSNISFVCPTIPEQRSLESRENMEEEEVTYQQIPQEQPLEAEGDRERSCIKRARRLSPRPPKSKKRDRCKPQLVYYAQQATASPFQKVDHRVQTDLNRPINHRAMSNTFLQDVMRKQYKPILLPQRIPSMSSGFSSPVCRDEVPCVSKTLDLDACSCCRGYFHNIDTSPAAPYRLTDKSGNNIYYDTSLYDMVPVKEKSPKSKIDEDTLRRRENFRVKESQRYPDKRLFPQPQQYLVNFNNERGFRDMKNNMQKRSKLPEKMSLRQPIPKFREQNPDTDSCSGDIKCTFDCGGIYAKPEYQKRRAVQRVVMTNQPPVVLKNAECLTISVNNTECQTASSKSVQLEPQPIEENKTEATLNQIKTILQTVLTEVKTNSQVRNQPGEKVRKDATVQKGASQSDMQAGSSFMNSYTYSPYNMEPCMNSCSRQTNGSLYGPGGPLAPPLKCVQNYPLFVQTTGRQCTCCFKNIPSAKYCPQTLGLRHEAPTLHIDKDNAHHRSKETEKLIQEIYKSITLNMEGTRKVTSTSENDDQISSSNTSRKTFKFSYVPSKRKELFSNTASNRKQSAALTSSVKRANFGDEVISNNASMKSKMGSRGMFQLPNQGLGDVESKETPATTESEREKEKETERDAERERSQSVYMVELPNGTTTAGDSSDTTDTTDTPESDETVVVDIGPKKKSKSGLFSKMARLFKPKAKKQKEEEVELSEEEGDVEEKEESASDSDDYQTIYSHQSKKPTKQVTYEQKPRYRTRPRSRTSHSRYHLHRAQERRASPYLEQEYRRRWQENLAFHSGQSPRFSSERQYSGDSEYPRSAYWRQYEARAAFVGQPGPVASEGPQEVRRPCPTRRPPLNVATKKGLAWLKKHKPACGEQWKRLILEG